MRTVLRVLEVECSTYYAHVNKQKKMQQQQTLIIHRNVRPAPGYSYTQDGKPISDEQISEFSNVYSKGCTSDFHSVSNGFLFLKKMIILIIESNKMKSNTKLPPN
jgi:hypothetical protein